MARKPNQPIELGPGDVERFWQKVAKVAIGDCLEWQSRTNVGGYGMFKVCLDRQRSFVAHMELAIVEWTANRKKSGPKKKAG